MTSIAIHNSDPSASAADYIPSKYLVCYTIGPLLGGVLAAGMLVVTYYITPDETKKEIEELTKAADHLIPIENADK